jgi:hypothetical protein
MKINCVVLLKKSILSNWLLGQFCSCVPDISFENDQMLNLAKFSREKRKKEKSKQRPERKR